MLVFCCIEDAHALRVSGVVEFSYREYTTKTGTGKTSEQQFIQSYQAGIGHYIWDPRFLVFDASTRYTLNSSDVNADFTSLDYNLATVFFPGRRITWQLFGTKTTNAVQSTGTLVGYDVSTRSYGGQLNLRLENLVGRGNNNNNNNTNNNNAGGRTRISLPDIMLSQNHMESESLSLTSPSHELRKDTKGSLHYRINSIAEVNIEGGNEQYENLLTDASYDVKNLNAVSRIKITRDADLTLNARNSKRTTENIAGFASSEESVAYGAVLDFREKAGLRHNYQYDHSRTAITPGRLLETDRIQARAYYKLTGEFDLLGGIDYNSSLSESESTNEKSELRNGSILTGIAYRNQDIPVFGSSFVGSTHYEFQVGFSNYSSLSGSVEGSGRYYRNNAGFGVGSKGWEFESLTLSYNYINKRDNSPVQNDEYEHTINVIANSTRIRSTRLNVLSTYVARGSRAVAGQEFLNAQSQNQETRQFTYDVNAMYTATEYLSFQTGMARNQASSSAYTISSLGAAPGSKVMLTDVFYSEADLVVAITRNLRCRGMFRDELRKANSGDVQGYQVNMDADYRIRSIFVTAQYRWRQDNPDIGQTNQQQSIYFKVTRPF